MASSIEQLQCYLVGGAVRDELLEWRRGENVQVSESRGAWVEKQSAGGGGKP